MSLQRVMSSVYDDSKQLLQRISDIAQEYRRTTETVTNVEELLDSQEWLIEACIEAAKEFKRVIK